MLASLTYFYIKKELSLCHYSLLMYSLFYLCNCIGKVMYGEITRVCDVNLGGHMKANASTGDELKA
jgi:hypothetical protein